MIHNWHLSLGRCRACNRKTRCVGADGPQDMRARFMLIGERPGKHEDAMGRPFIGKSGLELDNTYLAAAGLRREDIYITNICKCRGADEDLKPSPLEASTCSSHFLPHELAAVNPEVVILMGSTALDLIGGGDLERLHGIPIPSTIHGHKCLAVPMYHPAAGLHNSTLMNWMIDDWQRLESRLLDRSFDWLNVPERQPTYALLDDPDDVYTLMDFPGDDLHDSAPYFISIDTESHRGNLYSIQWSRQPYEGFMILADNKPCVDAFTTGLLQWNTVCLHYEEHDRMEMGGLFAPHHKFIDTMKLAWHLGYPQGLKTLGYRLCGVNMQGFEDVVLPYSKLKLQEWLEEALLWMDARPTITYKQLVTKVKEIRKPHPGMVVCNRVLSHLHSATYDPWEEPKRSKGKTTMRLYGREWLGEVERAIGPMPVVSLVNAPLDAQIHYACQDADITGRVATSLLNEIANKQHNLTVDEGDHDVI